MSTIEETARAWHFLRLSADGTPVLRDGTPAPPVGKWLTFDGTLNICTSGLHASRRAIDALRFVSWENAAACLVEVQGIGEEHADNLVCARRRIVGIVPCDELLRLFARECALSVAQYWTMPDIVREYLETGSEEIRDAAWNAARDAAWNAARDAAWNAARAAAAWAKQNALLESLLIAGMELDDACL